MKIKFGGFVITFDRPEILDNTITEIFRQSFPPDKLIVLDNGTNPETPRIVELRKESRLLYKKMSGNLGPAGAAKIGLEILSSEGYEWIFWGDDNDPPKFIDSFERLLRLPLLITSGPVGILGAVGQRYNTRTGNHIRVPDEDLKSNTFVSVDSVAGGHCMIVNAAVIKEGILPDPALFFGFEELDFCLKTLKSGYHLFADGDLFYRCREAAGHLNFRQPNYVQRQEADLIRQYYSVRNTLIILKNNSLFQAFTYQFFKIFGKIIYGFRFGWKYGRLNFAYLTLGIIHFMINRTGKFEK